MKNYIKCIHKGLYKELKSLRKLTIEEINSFEYISLKIFFLLFYEYYDIIKDYDNTLFNKSNIDLILYCGNLKMFKYYESKGFTYDSFKLNNYFSHSAYNKNIKILKYLLAKGADINYIHSSYRNAYFFAANNNNIKILKYLEKNGININYCHTKFMNVYLHCIPYAKLSTLKYLESQGIDIYKKDYLGRTAYIIAIYNSHSIKILKHLESKGINIFVKDDYNRIELQRALVFNKSKRIHKYLLKKYNYIFNNGKYTNILIHKNNSIKLIYI